VKKSPTSSGSQNRAGGPRTRAGIARASQNSAKHKININRILPEERKEASLCWLKVQEELRIRGDLEFEILDDITLARMRTRRTDRYEAHEFEMVRLRLERDGVASRNLRYSNAMLRLADPWESADNPDRDQLPPEECIDFLADLKTSVESEGPRPDLGLRILDWVYGKEFTPNAATLVFLYTRMKLAEQQCEQGNVGGDSHHEPNRDRILELLDLEIESQKQRIENERRFDEAEYESGAPVFPPDPILDRILRYRAANERELRRCLENLKAIRDLKVDS
jgi:hypothetical protein